MVALGWKGSSTIYKKLSKHPLGMVANMNF
jgi:hypothetical protein